MTDKAKAAKPARTKTAIDAKRGTVFFVDPTALTLIEDKAHMLYDERVHLPVSAALVQSISATGFLPNKPISVVKNGPKLEVADGRQRCKAAVEANRLRAAKGLDEVQVPVTVIRTVETGMENMIASNAGHQNENIVDLATKAERYMRLTNASEEAAAVRFCVSKATIKNWMTLLSCHPKVVAAVRAGRATLTDSLKFAKIEREKQVEALAELETSGASTPDAVERAVVNQGGPQKRRRPGLGRKAVLTLIKEKPKAFNARELLLLRFIVGTASRGEVAKEFPELSA